MSVTGSSFQLEANVFTLSSLLNASLVKLVKEFSYENFMFSYLLAIIVLNVISGELFFSQFLNPRNCITLFILAFLYYSEKYVIFLFLISEYNFVSYSTTMNHKPYDIII